MASPRKRYRISHPAFGATLAVSAVAGIGEALASQGPGGGIGTASSFTQMAMAVLVWGTSALVVGSGLIGAMRRR